MTNFKSEFGLLTNFKQTGIKISFSLYSALTPLRYTLVQAFFFAVSLRESCVDRLGYDRCLRPGLAASLS